MEIRKVRKAESIFSRVLEEIKPSAVETDATIASINIVISKLAKIVDKGVELKVVGSVARGTNLKGDGDIDVFVLFHKNTSKEELVRKGLAYGKKLAGGKRDRYEIKYAEHPYIRLYLDELGMKMDLVPALRIDEIGEMGTAVDRTPLHTNFINSHLTEKQRDDTRLLKYMLKAHNIYGAEVKTGGFPGYLCELLVYQYGSLLRFLDNASLFEKPVILDPKTKNKINDPKLVKKFNSEFIVIDPVDANRNVAAGVSPESFARFVMVSREFVKRPDISLFFGKGFSSLSAASLIRKFIKNSGLSLYLIKARVPGKSEDVVWPQLRKKAGIISDTLSRYDYPVFFSIQWVSDNNGFMLFVLPFSEVETRMLKGPDVFIRNAAENFVKEHPKAIGTVIKGSNLHLLEKNRYRSAESLFRAIIGGKLIKNQKDIDLRSAKLFVNAVPREYSEDAYAELMKRLRI
jgi:tRNA nucleotidyltransferase (CCA-adding enzyme)